MKVVNTPRKLARITPLKYPTAITARNPQPSDRNVARRTTANATRKKAMPMCQSPLWSTTGPRLAAGLRPITSTLSEKVRGTDRVSDRGQCLAVPGIRPLPV